MIPKNIPTNEIEVTLNFLKEVRDKRSLSLNAEDRLGDDFNERTLKELFESPVMKDFSRQHNVAIIKPFHNDKPNAKMDVLIRRPEDVIGTGYIVSVNDREAKFKFKVPDNYIYLGLKHGGLLLTLDGIVVGGGKIVNARITYRYNPEKPIEEQNLVLKKGE